jgi:hypothetical protein
MTPRIVDSVLTLVCVRLLSPDLLAVFLLSLIDTASPRLSRWKLRVLINIAHASPKEGRTSQAAVLLDLRQVKKIRELEKTSFL